MRLGGKLDYYYNSSSDEIYVIGLNKGKVLWEKVDFRPRFYVPEKIKDVLIDMKLREVVNIRPIDFKTADTKESVVEVQVVQPGLVPSVRDMVESLGVKTYESDIPYIKVLLMNDVLRVNYDLDNIAFFDVELYDYEFPKEYGKYKFRCIGAMDSKGGMYWVSDEDFLDERDMFVDFVEWLMKNNIEILVGWNVKFDYQHTLRRMKELGVPSKYIDYFGRIIEIDLMQEYKNVVKGLSSYSLEEVSKHEGWVPKYRDKRIVDMNYDELFEYNMYDVELLKKIEDKYGFVGTLITLANEMNLNIEHLSPVQIWDMLIIKRLHELGYVAWRAPRPSELGIKAEDLNYEGALVKEPEVGVWENVLYADFTSLYPSIVINEKVEIDGFNGEVLPYLMKKYFELRQEYKKKYKETGEKIYDLLQGAVKIIINGGYGALAYCSFGCDAMFRFFKLENAAFITAKGREIAKKTWKYLEENFPVKVLYIDTDGLQIWLGDDLSYEEALEVSELILANVNEYIAPYQLKFEDLFVKVMYFGEYDKKENRWVGIKKKYVALLKDGSYYIRGLEVRRGDASEFQKRIIKEVLDLVMKQNADAKTIYEYLKDVKKRLYDGEFDNELIIVKAVSKGIDEYKNMPPHIKALQKAQMLGYGFSDGRVRYVWTKDFPEPVWDGRDIKTIPIDYSRYWEYVMNSVRKIVVSSYFREIQSVLKDKNAKLTKDLKDLLKFLGLGKMFRRHKSLDKFINLSGR